MSECEEANYRDLIGVHRKTIEGLQRDILVHATHIRIIEKRLKGEPDDNEAKAGVDVRESAHERSGDQFVAGEVGAQGSGAGSDDV